MTEDISGWETALKTKPDAPRRTRVVKGAAGQRYAQSQAEPEPAPQSRRERIMGVFQTVSLPLLATQPADGATVIIHADSVAVAASDLAANDERFAKILDKFLQGGPYGALIVAVAPMVLQLATNHGLIPESVASKLNVRPKEEMEEVGKQMLAEIIQKTVGLNGQSDGTVDASTNSAG